jgi:hypothetical protein
VGAELFRGRCRILLRWLDVLVKAKQEGLAAEDHAELVAACEASLITTRHPARRAA